MNIANREGMDLDLEQERKKVNFVKQYYLQFLQEARTANRREKP